MTNVIAIVGSRDFKNRNLIRDFILTLKEGDTIVSGGASGVDNLAVLYARKLGHATIVMKANWDEHGKQAGFIRNQMLVDFIKKYNGEIHAFWDGKSKGTLDTLNKSQDAGIKHFIHHEDGTVTNELLAF